MYYVGIDVGGTNLKAGLVDESYRLVATKKMPLQFVSMEQMGETLVDMALLRLQYPEMSLSQLAEKCDPPVTKSCLNHRMRKLLEEAKKL